MPSSTQNSMGIPDRCVILSYHYKFELDSDVFEP